jgi:hypothetical protein
MPSVPLTLSGQKLTNLNPRVCFQSQVSSIGIKQKPRKDPTRVTNGSETDQAEEEAGVSFGGN